MKDLGHHGEPGGSPVVGQRLEFHMFQCTQHLCHGLGCCIVLVDSLGSSVLYTFQSSRASLSFPRYESQASEPYSTSDLTSMVKEVCFNIFGERLRFILRKPKCEFAFFIVLSTGANMLHPAHGPRYGHTQVSACVYFFQHSIIQLIELADGCTAGDCPVVIIDNTALLCIETHVPLDAPFLL